MRPLVCFLLAPALWAIPITPVLTLSNFQSSAQVSIDPTYGMFFGFAFADPIYDANDPLHIYVPIGGGGRLGSNPVMAQSIQAQASADFSVPGYRVTTIFLLGQVAGDGTGVGQSYSISSPCSAIADFRAICSIFGGLTSGTFSASMSMRSDLKQTFPLPGGGTTWIGDLGVVTNPRLMLTVEAIHSPEPGSFGLVLLAVGAVILLQVCTNVAKRRRR